MTKLETMLAFLKQKEGDPTDKTYPVVQRILDMRIKDSDDEFGAAGNHYIVRCQMLSYEHTGTSVNAVTPVITEATCFVDKHQFDLFYHKENAIIWVSSRGTGVPPPPEPPKARIIKEGGEVEEPPKQKNSVSDDELIRLEKWLKSDEGKKAIKESLDKADAVNRIIDKMRDIDPKILREPFTI